ncbi:transcription initiation factor TFIIIB [Anoxybacteroides rupiense]|uniref:transcription initiation factor TFIIIB n=1 Tax=Anoxybacteroides rupiense TaxID=311460 RepID=UPI00367208F2
MKEINECLSCGNKEIVQGKFQYEAKVQPINKKFSTGSDVLVDICSNCGLILSMKVENPEKFK